MGMDLNLLPLYSKTADFSHEILSVPRNYNLYDQINKLPQYPITSFGNDFYCYLSRRNDKGSHYGLTSEDPYGKPLQWVFAKDLKMVCIPGPTGAFVNVLPDDWKIVLYWY